MLDDIKNTCKFYIKKLIYAMYCTLILFLYPSSVVPSSSYWSHEDNLKMSTRANLGFFL